MITDSMIAQTVAARSTLANLCASLEMLRRYKSCTRSMKLTVRTVMTASVPSLEAKMDTIWYLTALLTDRALLAATKALALS